MRIGLQSIKKTRFLNIFSGNGQIPCRSQKVASISSGVRQPKEPCGLRELQKLSIYWKTEWYRSRQVRKLRLLVSSFLRYLKKLSQQALSKGYPFLEKDWTTFSSSSSFRNANAFPLFRFRWHFILNNMQDTSFHLTFAVYETCSSREGFQRISFCKTKQCVSVFQTLRSIQCFQYSSITSHFLHAAHVFESKSNEWMKPVQNTSQIDEVVYQVVFMLMMR